MGANSGDPGPNAHGKCHEAFSGGRGISTACMLRSNWELRAPLRDVVHLSCCVFPPIQQTFSDASLCPGHDWFSPETSNAVSVSSVKPYGAVLGRGRGQWAGRAMAGGGRGVRQGGPSEEMLPPVSGLSNTGQCPGRWAPRFPGAGWDRTPHVVRCLEKMQRYKALVLTLRCSRDPECVLHECVWGGI